MITTSDRTLNLEKIAAGVGKTHDDWVNSSKYWNNDDREMSRAAVILDVVEKLDFLHPAVQMSSKIMKNHPDKKIKVKEKS